MARIYKKNNSYYFSIEAGRDENTGKRQRIVRGGFKTKKDAQKAAIEIESKYNNHKIIVKQSDITLHDFIWNHWLEYHKQFIKESTLRNNGSIINVGVRENSLASTFIFLQKKKHKYILFS